MINVQASLWGLRNLTWTESSPKYIPNSQEIQQSIQREFVIPDLVKWKFRALREALPFTIVLMWYSLNSNYDYLNANTLIVSLLKDITDTFRKCFYPMHLGIPFVSWNSIQVSECSRETCCYVISRNKYLQKKMNVVRQLDPIFCFGFKDLIEKKVLTFWIHVRTSIASIPHFLGNWIATV